MTAMDTMFIVAFVIAICGIVILVGLLRRRRIRELDLDRSADGTREWISSPRISKAQFFLLDGLVAVLVSPLLVITFMVETDGEPLPAIIVVATIWAGVSLYWAWILSLDINFDYDKRWRRFPLRFETVEEAVGASLVRRGIRFQRYGPMEPRKALPRNVRKAVDEFPSPETSTMFFHLRGPEGVIHACEQFEGREIWTLVEIFLDETEGGPVIDGLVEEIDRRTGYD